MNWHCLDLLRYGSRSRMTRETARKVHYREYRSGFTIEENRKPPVILLHGMGFSGRCFKIVAPSIAFNTKRKVYAPDARNHGKSLWKNEMNYDVLTNDLLEFMEELGIERAVLLGSSMGGRTVMNFALKYPDKVEALIVEDMTPVNVKSSGMNAVQMTVNCVQEVLKQTPPESSENEAKRKLLDDVFSLLEPVIISSYRERILKTLDMDMIPIVKDGDTFRLECNVPVVITLLDNDSLVQNLPDQGLVYNGDALFLYGSKGFFKLGKDPSVKKLFPRAIVKEIPGSTHLIHLDSPDTYIDIVSDFILNRNLTPSKY